MSGGMDSPWRYLGERLGIRTDATVERVQHMIAGAHSCAYEVKPQKRRKARR